MGAPKGNKYALNSTTNGRPPVFKNPIDLEKKIIEYLECCKVEKEPLTICGLAYALGFESRQSFYDYEKQEDFTYIIKRARLAVETGYEKRLSGNCATGAIFALKNMGWKDEHEVSGGISIHFDHQDEQV